MNPNETIVLISLIIRIGINKSIMLNTNAANAERLIQGRINPKSDLINGSLHQNRLTSTIKNPPKKIAAKASQRRDGLCFFSAMGKKKRIKPIIILTQAICYN